MIAPWIWAVLLLALALAFLVMELFIPSGGVLAFLAAASVLGAVALGFKQGPAAGLGILMAVLVGGPAGLALAVKYWPNTSVGRRILLGVRRGDEVLPDSPLRRRYSELVGKIGKAKSQMLPSGVISIEGRTVDAFSEGMAIEVGQSVIVLEVHGTQVLVRPVDADEMPSPPQQGADRLSQPIDSIVPDPFSETTDARPLDNSSADG